MTTQSQQQPVRTSRTSPSTNMQRLVFGILVLLASTGNAFQLATPASSIASSKATNILHRSASTTTTTTTTTQRDMTLGDVSEFYATYPLQSAVLTCGFKASVADGIAQVRNASSMDRFNLEFRRNLAYILYGGLFIGIMCHLEYDHLFPILFGTEQNLKIIAEKVIFDDFVSAPLMWLPPAYLIKAMVYDYSLQEGLENYVKDIKENQLLQRYWTVWLPAQSISFSVVPDHLRVAFMASVSFFWFIILSTVASKGDNNNNNNDPAEEVAAAAAVTSSE